MYQLARWLTRHLNDPYLVLWVAEQKGHLHQSFRRLIEDKIEKLAKLEQDGEHHKLDDIRRAAPNAVPSPLMRTLWQLVLDGRLKLEDIESNLYSWAKRFKQDGLTVSLRMGLRKILAPQVVIREPSNRLVEEDEEDEHTSTDDLVGWEVVLTTNYVDRTMSGLRTEPEWENILPLLLSDFSLLLHDALDLMRELSGVEHREVYSCVAQPSIGDHPQNERFFDWTALIELTRDSWIAMARLDSVRARLVAEDWMQIPYPLFKRLAYFAAAQGAVIPVDQALDWLLVDEHWWLWSIDTQREVIRLLVMMAPRLDSAAMSKLERAILQGPPREMHGNWGEDLRVRLSDRNVWLRLAKLQDTGLELGEAAQNTFNELSQRHQNWYLENNQRDEFATWTSSSDDLREFIATPRELGQMVEWLTQYPSPDVWREDDWQDRCRDDFPTTSSALMALARKRIWPEERWTTALLAWTVEENLKISWDQMAGFFTDMSDEFLQAVAPALTLWLKRQAKGFLGQEQHFFGLIRRILKLEHHYLGGTQEDWVTSALNHPIGRVTEALMHWWNRRPPQSRDGFLDEIHLSLIDLCDPEIDKFRYGRVMLATHLITLYQVDQSLTIEHMLPFFDWQRSNAEAAALWQGFLFSPRLYWPLMKVLKKPFLDTAKHYCELGRYREQYGTLLAFAALDRHDTFNQGELAKATRTLPQEGLDYVAIRLVIALDGAGQQRGEYWKNRILPFLDSSWPRETKNLSSSISESFAKLSIAAGDAFPEALRRLKLWLRFSLPQVERLRIALRIIPKLYESQLCNSFPDDSLTLLETLKLDFGDEMFLSDELPCCLNAIRISNPSLIEDPRFRKLEALCRAV